MEMLKTFTERPPSIQSMYIIICEKLGLIHINHSITTQTWGHLWWEWTASHARQTSMKNSEVEFWSMILGTTIPHCLWNEPDQDKPENKKPTNLSQAGPDEWGEGFEPSEGIYLKLATYASLFKERRTCLSSFKQYCSVNHTMWPQNRCLHFVPKQILRSCKNF